jgi:RHS repeat-associated protein
MSYKVTNPIRFPSQYDDSDTKDIRSLIINNANGLYYNWNRWYNPDVGRYVEVDRLFFSDNYSYVNNNPNINMDCDGNKVISNSCNRYESKAKINEAINRAKDLILSCKYLRIIDKLLAILFLNDPWIRCGKSNGWCGCGYSHYGNVVILCSDAFDSKECGCLESTLFHEALHKAGYSGGGTRENPDPEHRKVFCLEYKCVDCAHSSCKEYCD